jgi:hypothetical protein
LVVRAFQSTGRPSSLTDRTLEPRGNVWPMKSRSTSAERVTTSVR